VGGGVTEGERFVVAATALRRMATWEAGVFWAPPAALLGLGFVVVSHAVQQTSLRCLKELPAGHWLAPILIFLLLGVIAVFWPKDTNPFIYFQF
jgi:hypothetical protein